MLPFRTPHRNRKVTAAEKVGENPNRVAAIRVPTRPLRSAILRPYLSASTPQKIFPKILPPLKAAPEFCQIRIGDLLKYSNSIKISADTVIHYNHQFEQRYLDILPCIPILQMSDLRKGAPSNMAEKRISSK